MKEQFKTYKAKYVKAKKASDFTGFGVSEDDQSNGIITITQKLKIFCACFEQMDVIFGSQTNITSPSVADTCKNCIKTLTMVDEHIDDLRIGLFDNAGYSQANMFEEREEGIENIQHHGDNNHQDLSIKFNEQQKWRPEKEQKDKELLMEFAMREKEIKSAKDGKDKEFEIRVLIADKDYEAMKFKENIALLYAVVGSSRSIEEITKISKISECPGLGFEEERVAEQNLGGGSHKGQSGWSKTTGAMEL
ncbi:hypothetical protein PPACK8108_LOCUS7830 [Phakopsora pachyrhizi]|uniref:Uncharacterized protein n=1 Tax=Phakopsora pachyrhizi TaxID=170000 RepID=A0AAV0ATN9_PHAPC|nr:hypothetical protein PPACK8108_LOCUS7830 [Phakopsora pachyrhizi]